MPEIITPSQTVGPYFAYALTPRDYGRPEIFTGILATPQTPGQRIRIEGRVLDGDGIPVTDAMVEIWQADATGRHAGSRRAASGGSTLPNTGFTGFGRVGTDAEESYAFETVKPGPVPGPNGQPQAPHINVSLFARGVLRRLFTRIYFADETANAEDPILALVPERRDTLIAR